MLLPIIQPEITGNLAVVLVHLAVAVPPVVELAGGDIEPRDEPPGADLGLLGPAPDEIHDPVPRIARNPDPGQSSPISFFSVTCSATSSARTSSLVWIFFSRWAIAPAGLNGWLLSSARRQPLRSRRAPSASSRTPSAAGPVQRRASRWAPCPANSASGWPFSSGV